MRNKFIRLVPADPSLAEQAANYYRRNRAFLQRFEPEREEAFFSPAYQKAVLEREMLEFKAKTSARFYIKGPGDSRGIIGMIGLNNIVYGAFQSAFLGYKLDKDFVNRGYMTAAVGMMVAYAFEDLRLHRIEANVMPGNLASLRVLEKCRFVEEGISKYYLNINGVWEDHIHMVRLNDAMHGTAP